MVCAQINLSMARSSNLHVSFWSRPKMATPKAPHRTKNFWVGKSTVRGIVLYLLHPFTTTTWVLRFQGDPRPASSQGSHPTEAPSTSSSCFQSSLPLGTAPSGVKDGWKIPPSGCMSPTRNLQVEYYAANLAQPLVHEGTKRVKSWTLGQIWANSKHLSFSKSSKASKFLVARALASVLVSINCLGFRSTSIRKKTSVAKTCSAALKWYFKAFCSPLYRYIASKVCRTLIHPVVISILELGKQKSRWSFPTLLLVLHNISIATRRRSGVAASGDSRCTCFSLELRERNPPVTKK